MVYRQCSGKVKHQNSTKSMVCFCLLGAGFPGVYHHTQIKDALNADSQTVTRLMPLSLIFLTHDKKM